MELLPLGVQRRVGFNVFRVPELVRVPPRPERGQGAPF